jgi:hypothetical protein
MEKYQITATRANEVRNNDLREVSFSVYVVTGHCVIVDAIAVSDDEAANCGIVVHVDSVDHEDYQEAYGATRCNLENYFVKDAKQLAELLLSLATRFLTDIDVSV